MRARTIILGIGIVALASASTVLAAPDTWDSRLTDLGVCYFEANVSAGTWYWKLISGVYEDPNQSGGNHHIYYKCLNASGQPIENQKCWTGWGSTGGAVPCPVPPNPPDGTAWQLTKGAGDGYWANFGMAGGWCPYWPEGSHGPYGAWVDGPSDTVWGMGLPCNQHVNYLYVWQWTQKGGAVPPAISRSPTSFTRSITQGQNLASDSFSVWNSGGGTLNYTITDNVTWLSVNPPSGNSTGETDTITINYTTSGLAEGTYNATITISDEAASNSPQTITVSLTVTPGGSDQAGYRLAYWFEVGGYHNQDCSPPCEGGGASCTGFGNHSAYVHVWDSNGNMLGNKRVEDADNPSKYGITNNDPNDKLGFAEIPLFMSDTPRFTVNDGGVLSDIAPEVIENRSPTNGHYSWELGFIYVPGGLGISFNTVLIGQPNLSGTPADLDAPFTTSCAFYDTNPFAWTSDDYCLDSGSSSYGQTFVANGNCVVAAKFQPTVGFLQDLRYGVTIRAGGPGGVIVGPQAMSRWMKSDEYFTQTVRWALGAVPVVSGQTYYAEIVRVDQPGSINIWRRDNDVYPNGQMYRGGSPVSGKDLIGRVVCATVGTTPTEPQIAVSPPAFERTVALGHSLSSNTFEVWNSGSQTLNYTISDNAGWLSEVPEAGSSTGEHDTITIQYTTSGLPLGDQQALIQVSAAGAINSPQTIPVTVHVVPVTFKGDCNGDDDVDQEDFGQFQVCLSGPGIEQTDPDCTCAKLDGDADVDQDDFAVFEDCMSGGDVTPPSACEK